MKTKMNFSSLVNIKFILPVIAFAIFLFSSCGKNEAKTEVSPGAFQDVDEMPVFPGGDTALLQFIARKTIYPEDAKNTGITGKVVAKFIVKADGSVSDVSIIKSANPSLDKEAIRVVSTLPNFAPGKMKGKAVPVWFMIPIEFKLK